MRFFSERRAQVAFVDLARKPLAVAELRRFTQKYGARALFDSESARYRETGLAYLAMDDAGAFDRLLADPGLLRLPLIRAGTELSVGIEEDAWRSWLSVEG